MDKRSRKTGVEAARGNKNVTSKALLVGTRKSIPEPLTPKETVKALCQHCLGLGNFQTKTILHCGGNTLSAPCPLFEYRLGKKRITVRALREYCIHCTRGDRTWIAACNTTQCWNWHYRMGKNPRRAGITGNVNNLKVGNLRRK